MITYTGFEATKINESQWAIFNDLKGDLGRSGQNVSAVAGDRTVEISDGSIRIKGVLCEVSGTETRQSPSNGSSNPRIDALVWRVDWAANTAVLEIKAGTPAVSPVRPSLSRQVNDLWEEPIAYLNVGPGQGAFTDSDVTQLPNLGDLTGPEISDIDLSASAGPSEYPFGLSIGNARSSLGWPEFGQVWTHRANEFSRVQQIMFSTTTGRGYTRMFLRHQASGGGTEWTEWEQVYTQSVLEQLRPVKANDGTNIGGYGNNGVFAFVAPAVGRSFTAPPSGRVMYQTFCRFNVNNEASPQMNWRFTGEIREGTSSGGQLIDPPSNDACGVYEHNTADLPFDMERSVTSPWLEVAGLTPGNTYTAWWKIRNGGGDEQQRLDIFFRQVFVWPVPGAGQVLQLA